MTEIMAREKQNQLEGPAEFFTGRVTIRGQFARDEPSRVTGAVVTFEPERVPHGTPIRSDKPSS